MKVRALRTGFFDHKRRRGDDTLGEGRGDVFTIPDEPRRKVRKVEERKFETFTNDEGEEKKRLTRIMKADTHEVQAAADKAGTVPEALGSWMVPVERATKERTTTAQQALDVRQNDLKAQKGDATGDAEVI
jgi:hypothetical protein